MELPTVVPPQDQDSANYTKRPGCTSTVVANVASAPAGRPEIAGPSMNCPAVTISL